MDRLTALRRLARVLDDCMRVSGLPRHEIEARMGMSVGYLSRILRGSVKLRADHIFRLLEVLGVEPGEVFRVAFPELGHPSSILEGLREIGYLVPEDRMTQRATGTPSLSPVPSLASLNLGDLGDVSALPALPDDELDRRIRASLRKLFVEGAEADGPQTGPQTNRPPARSAPKGRSGHGA